MLAGRIETMAPELNFGPYIDVENGTKTPSKT